MYSNLSFFWPCGVAYWILVPQPGLNPCPLHQTDLEPLYCQRSPSIHLLEDILVTNSFALWNWAALNSWVCIVLLWTSLFIIYLELYYSATSHVIQKPMNVYHHLTHLDSLDVICITSISYNFTRQCFFNFSCIFSKFYIFLSFNQIFGFFGFADILSKDISFPTWHNSSSAKAFLFKAQGHWHFSLCF